MLTRFDASRSVCANSSTSVDAFRPSPSQIAYSQTESIIHEADSRSKKMFFEICNPFRPDSDSSAVQDWGAEFRKLENPSSNVALSLAGRIAEISRRKFEPADSLCTPIFHRNRGIFNAIDPYFWRISAFAEILWATSENIRSVSVPNTHFLGARRGIFFHTQSFGAKSAARRG